MKTSSSLLWFSCAIVLAGLAVTVKAQTMPTITCSSNRTVSTCAINGEQVSFNVTATSPCAPVTVTCMPPSASVFPLGTNTVVCRALDACSNVASCTFTVIVERGTNCSEVASATGGEASAPQGSVEVTAAMLAELIRTDRPLPLPEPDEEHEDMEDEVPPLGAAPFSAGVGGDWSPTIASAPAAPQVSQTPEPVTSWMGPGPVGGRPGDPQIAVSHTHIVVSGRAKMSYYNKAGTELKAISAATFFKPLGLNDGTVDAINTYTDLRSIFDAYRQRFWVVAFGWNKSQTDPTKARYVVTLGVSKTENPFDGWYLYWWYGVAHQGVPNDVIYQPGDKADYPTIGIDPNLFHQTIGVFATNGSIRYWHVRFFNASQMAAGLAGASVQGWQFWDLKNPDGTTLTQTTQATVHHGATGRSYYVSRRESNKVVVWALTGAFTPQQSMSRVALTFSPSWQSPVDMSQPGSTNKVKTTNLGTHALKSVYRGGLLHLVTQDARDWFNDGQMLTSVRFIRLFVLGFPNIPTAGDPSYINWTLGMNGPGDSSTAHVHYSWPAVEVNKHADMVMVYARSSSQHYPEIRASAFFDGDAVISPSRRIKLGEAPADLPICDDDGNVTGPGTTSPVVWGDIGGASVDPKDDEAVWIVHQYAFGTPNCACNYQLWVAKIFGSTFSDWHFDNFDVTVGNFQPGTHMEVSGQLNNQGDGTANTNRVLIYLNQPGQPDLLLTQVAVPALRPTENFTFRASFTVPMGISSCGATIKAVVNPNSTEDEYSQDNNMVVADVPSKLAISLVPMSGPYHVRVFGKEGCRYTLQGSPDLVGWADLTTQTIVNGSYEFVDVPMNFPNRFYRAFKAP